MKALSNLEDKIVKLKEEINSLKTSQILGGDNSRVYRHYITGTSAPLYKMGDSLWVPQEYYDDPEWLPVPGVNYGIVSSVEPISDDPFAILGVERIEVSRGGKSLIWADYEYYQGDVGQISQYGDHIQLFITKIGNGWGMGSTPRLGPAIQLGLFPGHLSDNPSSPIQYDFKIWLKSTSLVDYKFIPDSGTGLY